VAGDCTALHLQRLPTSSQRIQATDYGMAPLSSTAAQGTPASSTDPRPCAEQRRTSGKRGGSTRIFSRNRRALAAKPLPGARGKLAPYRAAQSPFRRAAADAISGRSTPIPRSAGCGRIPANPASLGAARAPRIRQVSERRAWTRDALSSKARRLHPFEDDRVGWRVAMPRSAYGRAPARGRSCAGRFRHAVVSPPARTAHAAQIPRCRRARCRPARCRYSGAVFQWLMDGRPSTLPMKD